MPSYSASWYTDGSVTVAKDSDMVVGVGTLWELQAKPGDIFTLLEDDGKAAGLYEVVDVKDNTHIQLKHTWQGAGATGKAYAVIRNFGGRWSVAAEIAADLAAHIREFKLALQNNLKGDKGDKGDNGKTLLSQASDPVSGEGIDGDWWLNFATWDMYRKEAGIWVKRGSLRGDKGEPGKDGARLYQFAGPPGADVGNPGDTAHDTTNGDIYARTPGGWTKTGNIRGPQGEPGDTGAQGQKGDKGDQGRAGTSIYAGDALPQPTEHNDGDQYVHLPTGDVYTKTVGAWAHRGNVKGPRGIPGTVWMTGDSAPDNSAGVDGDMYTDTRNGDYYSKIGGAWQKVGNLRGPAGPAGSGSGDMLTATFVDPITGRIKKEKAGVTESDLMLTAIIYG